MYREILPARFENVGEHAVAIVAVINRDYDSGVLYDWAAYIGCYSSQSEQECYEHVAEYGNKLRLEDAYYFFPGLPANKWRS